MHKNLVGSGNETGKYPAADSDLFDSDLFECIFLIISVFLLAVAFVCVAPDTGPGGNSL
jgi:hypothetical protein